MAHFQNLTQSTGNYDSVTSIRTDIQLNGIESRVQK